MAKFNVEIDLDWVDEDSSVNDIIKGEIISKVEKRVFNSLIASVKAQTEKMVAEKIDVMVTDEITARITKFLETPRDITDSYGEVIEKGVTVESLLKRKIEGCIDEKTLDEDGRSASKYNVKYTVLEYFAVKRAKEIIGKFTKIYMVETEENIKSMVETKIKTEVADKLTNLIVNNSTTLGLKTGKALK